jgi:iron-sulfur cluster repair protein YtfE (RIC family)
MLVAVTDHAAERFRQRVRGSLDEKIEIASRVARAHAAGRFDDALAQRRP